MNKIFKVVWSKTKECYVVVSEVAKNNSGKKKVLASVLAALAVVGAGAAQVDAASYGAGGGNAAADASISIGGGYSGPKTAANDKFAIAIGDNASATGKSSISMGYKSETNGQVSIAIGEETKVKKSEGTAVGAGAVVEERFGAAFGHEAKATKQYATAIGSGAQGEGEDSQAIGRQAQTTGYRAVAVGTLAKALNNSAIAIGEYTKADGTNSIAMGKSSKAHSFDAIAIGHNNNSRTYSAISIGTDNTSDVAYGLTDAQFDALPYDEQYINDSSKTDPRRGVSSTIAIGRNNVAGNVEAIAIGTETKATKTDAIAIGARAEATGDYALAIGGAAGGYKVTADEYGTAVGVRSNAANRGAAFGAGSNAGSQKSVAIGYTAKASAQKATSNYEFSGSHGTPSPAGYNTETITVNSASAPAGGAVAGNYYDAGSGIAIGNGATVSDESDRAVVVGPDAKTNGNAHYSVVLGSGSHADASDGFVAGHGSYVESRESIAMGSAAHVSGNENIRSQAIGYGATVSGTGAYDATAIGATAQVSGVQGGVALGAGSLLSRTTNSNENIGWNSKYVDGTVVRNRAYKAKVNALDQWDAGAQIGAVSVGNDTQKRQIINVAAGSQDTDAVNVAQLKNVGVRVGADTNTATIGTNKVAADFLAYNGQLNIKGDNNRVTTVSENDANGKDANVNVKFDYDGLVKSKTGSAVTVDQKTDGNGKTYFEIDAAAASKTVLADGKNTTVTGAGTTASPYKVNVEGALTGISSITNNGGGKIEFTTGGTTISGGPVNVSNNKITGVDKGDVSATSTDAVNGSQLYAVKAAERHIAPTTAGHEYTVDSNGDVTMTYLDGNNNAVANEKAVIKGIAKQDLSNINDAGKKVITGLGTIVKAGDNVNVSESSDATTGQKTYTVNAVTPAVYTKADGTKVVKRPNGTFTTNLDGSAGNDVDKGDVITSFMDGNGNTTGGNMVINNVGSAIDKTGTSTGNTFLTKLDTAATNTPNAAVNVKDLKTTSDALVDKGLNFTGNNEATVNKHKLGSLVKVQGEGVAATDVPGFASAAGNIAVVANGTDTLEIKLNKNLKGINSVSNGSSSITLNSNPGGTNNTPAVQITGGNLSMGNGTTNNKIVNLAPGTADTDAVNVKQLKDTELHITPGTYTPGTDKKVKLTYTDGNGGLVSGKEAVIDLSGLSTGGTTASSWNVKSSANTTDGGAVADTHDANAQNIANGKSVEFQSGKNLVVKQTNDTTGGNATVEFSLADNIVAGKDGANGKDGSVGATGKDGSSVVINGADGSIGMTGPKGQDGKDGINGRDGANISMTSAKGEQVLVNRDPAHSADTDKAERIVYVPKDASGNPIQGADGKNIVREVATMDDGLKFAGDDAQGTDKSKVIAKKLNNTVDIIGGANSANLTNNNIGVNNDNGKLKVQLAKTIDLTKDGSVTTGNTKVDNSGVTITAPTGGSTTNVTLTQSGLDNGGNKITNVKAGTDNTDAVNVKQLKDTEKHIKPGSYAVQSDGSVTLNYQDGNNNDLTETAKITGIAKQNLSNIDNAGKKVITGLGSIVEAGDNVTVTSTENATTGQKTYTVNAVTPVVYTTPSGDKLTKKSDGKFYKADGSEYTGGDIIASFENPNANSIPAGKNSTTDGGMIVNNIGSAIKNQTPTMPAGQTATYLDKLKAAADAGSNVKNAAVNVSDLHNTAEALKSNELHIRPTVTNRTGETVNQNAGGTAESYKYDSTTKSVTLKYNDGTGAGVTGTEAKIDLSDLANQITSGYTFKTNATENGGKVVNDVATPAAETAVANGGVVNYAAGKNLTVKQDIEKDGTGAATGKQTYTYALADEIGIGEKGQPGVAGKDGVDGKVGVNGKDGSSVVINGKDGSIGMTGPQGKDGKDGINGRDGANISMTSAKGEQVLINRDPAHSADTDKAERIVYVPKDASGNPIQDANGKNIVREVATMDDGLKFTGNNESTVNNNKLNTLVKVQGEGTKEDTNAAGAKEIQTSDGTKFESAKDNIAVVADGTNTLTVKLNKNLKGLDSVQTKTVELGDHTTPGGTTNITYNSGDKRIEYTTPGATGGTETKKVATTDDIWTIQGNGTDVAPVNGKVNVKAGENILITTPATADGSMTINAVTPAVYTDKDGNKLTKDKDGKFHKSDGTEVAATDVITSIQDAAGNVTGGNSIVNNVGSAINNHATPGVTSPTYLDKLDAAAGDTKTQNAAVNVTDLKNTADGLTDKGLKFDANEGGVKTNKLGSTVTVQGSGALTAGKAYADEYNTDNIRTKIEQGTDGNTTINVGLAKELKGINSISNGNSSITISNVPAGATTPAVTISGGNLSMGDGTTNNKIVNLAPGTANTDAVNVKQLKDTELHITPGTYTPGTDKKVKLTYTDGNGGVVSGKEAVIDLSGLSTGGTTASSWNVKSSANTTDGGAVADTHDANAQNIANGKSVEFQSGKNLVVKQTNDTTGGNATVEFSLADNIVAGKDGANGKDGSVGATGKDGSSVVINGADGSIGMTGPKGQDGKDGINGRDGANISMTSAKGEQVLINRDPAHSADTDKAERIVYVPKDASGNPIQDANGKNIVREVATMDDGLKFGGDMGTVNSVKLNKQVDVKGGITDTNKLATGNNIGVTSGIDPTTNNATLNVQLAKDITGLNSVQIGGNTIKTDGDHITITTPNTTPGAAPGATTTTKVANLADELHIEDTTYTIGDTSKRNNAANDEVTLTYKDGNGAEVADKYAIIKGVAKSDLSNINTAGKKVITGLSSVVKAGDNVTVKTDTDATTNQKTYTVNAVTPAVYTKADGTKVYKIVDPTTGAVTWNTKADGTGTPVNANEVIASFETPANGTTQGATTGGTMIVNNIGSAISGHEAKDTAGTVITSPTYLQRLETAAGDNLTKHAAVNVSDLNSAAKELKASELHIAPTEGGTDTDKGGGASGNSNAGAAAQAYKYNAATKQVELTFNDGNGKAVTGPKAVIDFSDLVIPAGGNNYGFKTNAGGNLATGTTTSVKPVASGKTVTYAAGKNLTVKQEETNGDLTYTYALDKDLTNLDKIVVNGKDGIAGKDGVTIVGPQGATGAPGMPGTNGIDGKVGISGKDGKDAVSISGKDGVGHIGLTGPQGPAGTPGAPGTPGANIDISTDHGTQTLVKPEANNNDKSERIVYVPKDSQGNPLKDTDGNVIKREVATMDDGLRFTGNNTSKENKQEMNSLVKVQGEGVTENATSGKLEVNGQEFKSAAGNIAVVADGGNTLTVKMNKDLNLTKDGSLTIGDTKVNNDGITITGGPSVTKTGINAGNKAITNVANGTNDSDAVNVSQLKGSITTVQSSDGSISVTDANAGSTDPTKGHAYDIKINNQRVVEKAQTPVVYTDKDGHKVYKIVDPTTHNVTFNTKEDGSGITVQPADVIASMNNGSDSTNNPMKLNNVGSSIEDHDTPGNANPTFLDKLDAAAGDNKTKHGAVNVSDLKNTADAIGEKGLNFGTQSTGANSEIHKDLGEKLEIVGGGTKADGEYDASNIKTMTKDGKVVIALDKNIKADSVTVGEKGQPGVPGKDGVDGKIGVNGKDGSAVVINGKDGSIGLNGKDGANGITIKGDKGVDGVDGLNGTNGITRIVYQDKDGNKHEVATHDDGMKFAGDDGQTDPTKVIKKHLNNVVDIVGGADKTKLTDNNIGVNNDGGKLKVQLIKDVNLTDTGSIKFGDTANNNTVINRGGITITTPAAVTTDPAVTVSLTGNGLNNGGNKITNVKNGTAPTDAATVGQLTKVEAGDNSVTVDHTTTADGQNVYTIKANPAGTVDLTNVNNRIDQLGEEVGRVGAQGAALSALKPIQYDPLEPTQIMAGYGNYRGNSAVALGVAHYKNESTLIHGGVSWAGGSSHMMANAGVTWKVGNRDSEAAVADRYRKGPISSAYAMQQEMAAMKAQNAGLKGEVSDLKAENEQMKAQIAAMMAKLGL